MLHALSHNIIFRISDFLELSDLRQLSSVCKSLLSCMRRREFWTNYSQMRNDITTLNKFNYIIRDFPDNLFSPIALFIQSQCTPFFEIKYITYTFDSRNALQHWTIIHKKIAKIYDQYSRDAIGTIFSYINEHGIWMGKIFLSVWATLSVQQKLLAADPSIRLEPNFIRRNPDTLIFNIVDTE